MPENQPTAITSFPPGRRARVLVFAFVAVILCSGIYVGWRYFDPTYRFSQEQYDEGYYSAFRMNATGRAHMDYKSEFWSIQQGFDDALSDFQKIYEHPNVGPFSYSRIERLREVLSHIEKSDVLAPYRRQVIVEQLNSDLVEWESSTVNNGG